MKVLSLNVEYLTLSVDVITTIKLNLEAEEIRQGWLLRAPHREEASRFALIATDLTSVVDKLHSRTLWHPTSRMRLIQFLFHTYGTDPVAKATKEKKEIPPYEKDKGRNTSMSEHNTKMSEENLKN